MRIYNKSPSIGFVTDELPGGGGYTWTLTTCLGQLLQQVEQAYGPRDKTWTVLGIEFANDYPQVWYPGRQNGRSDVVIQLSRAAALDDCQALYQLAHEVVHLLAPLGLRGAPVIEEALATVFSEKTSFLYGLNIQTPEGKYKEAARLLRASKFESHISSARDERPRFIDWDIPFLKSICPDLPDQTAAQFCTSFQEWTP